MGARALPAARRRGPADRHRRPLPAHLRGLPRAAASAARRLPAPGADPARAVPGLVALLLARQAPDGAATSCCPAAGDPDESLGAFVRRRLGREALERVAQPLVGGIYTADPDELSLAATMPRFLEMERRERSVILGPLARRAAPGPGAHAGTSGARWSLFVTFAEGMEELIRLLATRLPPGAVRLKERAVSVARDGARLARRHRGRRGLHRRRAHPGPGGPPGRAPAALRGSRASRTCSRGSRTRRRPP